MCATMYVMCAVFGRLFGLFIARQLADYCLNSQSYVQSHHACCSSLSFLHVIIQRSVLDVPHCAVCNIVVFIDCLGHFALETSCVYAILIELLAIFNYCCKCIEFFLAISF